MNRRRALATIAFGGAALWLGPRLAEAATVVGKVSRLAGACENATGGRRLALWDGAPIHLDDVVSTGKAARVEIGFRDGTVLTVGERARVKIDQFVYRPRGSANRLLLAVKGPFRFVSGKLTKTAGAEASVATPFATIGIRGTDFWGGPIDGAFGVFLIEGAVSVTNNAGAVSMNASGQGTNVVGPDQAPGAVTIWPQAKVARALAAVTFP